MVLNTQVSLGMQLRWVECLPGVHKAHGSIPSTAYTGCEDAFPVIPVFTKQRRENQFGVILDYSTVSSIKASLGYRFVKGERVKKLLRCIIYQKYFLVTVWQVFLDFHK